MGEESEEVLASVIAEEEDQGVEQQQQTYDSVIEKFEKFFRVRKNVIFERARFNRRNQAPGESAEEYIMALYKLAEDCDYGIMKSELIRDRLVVGIRDTNLSERLQLDPKLTLESAKKAVRQREAVKEQQKELSISNTGVDTVRASRRQTNTPITRQRTKNVRTKQPQFRWQKCTRCGKEPHKRDICPARDAKCHQCNRRGHYSSQCLSKTVAEISSHLEEQEGDTENDEEGDNSDSAFLDAVSDKVSTKGKQWKVTLHLNGRKEEFKIDTGADVMASSEQVHQQGWNPLMSNPARVEEPTP